MRGIILPGLLMCMNAAASLQGIGSYCVYYNDQAPVKAFDPYDLIVLDSDHHPNLRALTQRKKKLLGYISLGEAEKERAYFKELEGEGILLAENPFWPGSYYVDLRDPRWSKRVIEELIPKILIQRFHGLFLDTLDNAGHLEREDPIKYAGMISAAVKLVKDIREHYPDIDIMLNRAYEILPDVASVITMEMGESIYTDYNFETKTYQKVHENLFLEQVKQLKKVQKEHPHLILFSLDYWDPQDVDGIREIYKTERSHGLIPYVATLDLQTLVPEPK